MIEKVIISNYKSIRNLELPLQSINVLIGSNGVGKSNLISFFELAKSIIEKRFGRYTLEKGGIDNLLYRTRRESDCINGLLDFDNTNAFLHSLQHHSEPFIIKKGENNFSFPLNIQWANTNLKEN